MKIEVKTETQKEIEKEFTTDKHFFSVTNIGGHQVYFFKSIEGRAIKHWYKFELNGDIFTNSANCLTHDCSNITQWLRENAAGRIIHELDKELDKWRATFT